MTTRFDILLVEDDPVVREAAARILQDARLQVDRAEDVESAVAALRESEHSVILADLMLPGFSGFDLLERVAHDRSRLPVVLITGYATIDNALRAFKSGAFDFLPKPFDVAELMGVTRRALCAADRGSWTTRPQRSEAGGEAAGADSGRRYFLGQHSWVRVEGDRASFGVAESFPGLLGQVEEMRLPDAGEMVTQGLAFAEISTRDGAIHRVWAPLSGTVIQSNNEVREVPDLVNRDPFDSGWMTRIVPSSIDDQLAALTQRSATTGHESDAGG